MKAKLQAKLADRKRQSMQEFNKAIADKDFRVIRNILDANPEFILSRINGVASSQPLTTLQYFINHKRHEFRSIGAEYAFKSYEARDALRDEFNKAITAKDFMVIRSILDTGPGFILGIINGADSGQPLTTLQYFINHERREFRSIGAEYACKFPKGRDALMDEFDTAMSTENFVKIRRILDFNPDFLLEEGSEPPSTILQGFLYDARHEFRSIGVEYACKLVDLSTENIEHHTEPQGQMFMLTKAFSSLFEENEWAFKDDQWEVLKKLIKLFSHTNTPLLIDTTTGPRWIMLALGEHLGAKEISSAREELDLVMRGASVEDCRALLSHACQLSVEALKYMLTHGNVKKELNYRSALTEYTVLMKCMSPSAEIVRKKVDLSSPIIIEKVKLLLENGADPRPEHKSSTELSAIVLQEERTATATSSAQTPILIDSGRRIPLSSSIDTTVTSAAMSVAIAMPDFDRGYKAAKLLMEHGAGMPRLKDTGWLCISSTNINNALRIIGLLFIEETLKKLDLKEPSPAILPRPEEVSRTMSAPDLVSEPVAAGSTLKTASATKTIELESSQGTVHVLPIATRHGEVVEQVELSIPRNTRVNELSAIHKELRGKASATSTLDIIVEALSSDDPLFVIEEYMSKLDKAGLLKTCPELINVLGTQEDMTPESIYDVITNPNKLHQFFIFSKKSLGVLPIEEISWKILSDDGITYRITEKQMSKVVTEGFIDSLFWMLSPELSEKYPALVSKSLTTISQGSNGGNGVKQHGVICVLKDICMGDERLYTTKQFSLYNGEKKVGVLWYFSMIGSHQQIDKLLKDGSRSRLKDIRVDAELIGEAHDTVARTAGPAGAGQGAYSRHLPSGGFWRGDWTLDGINTVLPVVVPREKAFIVPAVQLGKDSSQLEIAVSLAIDSGRYKSAIPILYTVGDVSHWIGLVITNFLGNLNAVYVDPEKRSLPTELRRVLAAVGIKSDVAQLIPRQSYSDNCGETMIAGIAQVVGVNLGATEQLPYVLSERLSQALTKAPRNVEYTPLVPQIYSAFTNQILVSRELTWSSVFMYFDSYISSFINRCFGTQLKYIAYSKELAEFRLILQSLGMNDISIEEILTSKGFRRFASNTHPDSGKLYSLADKAEFTKAFVAAKNLKTKFEQDIDLKPLIDAGLQKYQPVLYKATIGFKALDISVDAVRFYQEPQADGAKKLIMSSIHLYSMYSGSSLSILPAAISVIDTYMKSGAVDALSEASTHAAYIILPSMLIALNPYLGFTYAIGITGMTAYNAMFNAYSLYQESYGLEQNSPISLENIEIVEVEQAVLGGDVLDLQQILS